MKPSLRHACVTSIAIALVTTSAIAQTMPATTQAATRPAGDFHTFVVMPRAVPVPAFRYRLTVPAADRVEGNAALFYLQTFALLPEDKGLGLVTDLNFDTESDGDYGKAIEAQANWLTTSLPIMLPEAEACDHCDWGIPLAREHYNTLLPHLNRSREEANYLMAKARLAQVRGDLDQAIALIRSCSVMADRLDDDTPIVVTCLVSAGIQMMCMDRLASVPSDPRSPNLYWALRALPMPFANVRRAAEYENALLFNAVPLLKRARSEELSALEWHDAIVQTRAVLPPMAVTTNDQAENERERRNRAGRLSDAAVIAANDAAILAAAKASYAHSHRVSDAEAGRIDAVKLVASFYFNTYRTHAEDVLTTFVLPYSQMLARQRLLDARYKVLLREQPSNPFLIATLPTYRYTVTCARLDLRIAAMTVVESLRAYAAAHDGTLPPTLDAIVDTPTPDNPVTGKPFEYSVNGDVATISDAGTLVDWPLRYEVRLRK